MSEPTPTPYDPQQAAQLRAAQAKAHARAAIEAAIVTLQTHRQHLTGGQAKAIKRILYDLPEAP